jgi:hypothetical protein
LAAFWQQISPIVPVLPTVPAHKSYAVYNLAFEAFHGMEEVVGSIPTRSTKFPFKLEYFDRWIRGFGYACVRFARGRV